eukprot:TRINITY_DN72936_c0_g1_i1.p1 TRINITY_DN72936_c0_g1~~TRINITY_DN72936_c0_g1_i1.p1  ORF type:complete len:634 (+),score=114.71 TRINITY_DN72936_c0_g1_i1:75-1904(+)
MFPQEDLFQAMLQQRLAASALANGLHVPPVVFSPSHSFGLLLPPALQPTSLDLPRVLAAIDGLYRDRLKPYGRILRKRIAEQMTAAGFSGVDVDIALLRRACESCPWLHVQNEEGGDWSATFRFRSPDFVDVYSPEDPYPPQLWKAAANYFDSLDETRMVLPGGRYSCAQALAGRELPFFKGLSLGQLCHVVQLAISKKKLLGYLNGAVVPYARSQSMVKERCAERGRPCSSAARGTTSLASWDLARACLKEIMKGLPTGSGFVPLSNVKRLFRSRFHLELSETALGHSKLSELLQDERLEDLCAVKLQGHGYVVVPAPRQSVDDSSKGKEISVAEAMSVAGQAAGAKKPGLLLPHEKTLCLESHLPTEGGMEESSRLPTLLPRRPLVQRKEQQSPRRRGQRGRQATQQPQSNSLRERAQWVAPLCMEDVASPRSAADEAVGSDDEDMKKAAKVQLSCLARLHMTPTTTPTPTPGGALRRTRSVPKKLGSATEPGWDATCGVLSAEGISIGSQRSTPCRQSNQAVVTPQMPGASLGSSLLPSDSAAAVPRPMLTPCTLGDMGFSVHNTFIHAAMPPPTPPSGGIRRSQSLPRNMGANGGVDDIYALGGG